MKISFLLSITIVSFIIFLLLQGCVKNTMPPGGPVTAPSPSGSPIAQSPLPLPDHQASRNNNPGKGTADEHSVAQEIEEAKVSDFSLPLYPGGFAARNGKIKGISPREKNMIISTIEMYSVDSVEMVVDYYTRREKKISLQKFVTDTGIGVLVSDKPSTISIPGQDCDEGTTLIVSRDNKTGKTTLRYTSFRLP
jgi:hypothetical protein